MNSRRQGQMGEMEASRYLRQKGYDILAANYRTRLGEIDIVARDGEWVVFVEVKTRAPGSMIRPLEAVTPVKQKRMIAAALSYLERTRWQGSVRFDVIEVVPQDGSFLRPSRIQHIVNAFEAGEGHAFF